MEQLDASSKEFDEFEDLGMRNDVKPTKLTLKKKPPTKETKKEDPKQAAISLSDQGAPAASAGGSSNWVDDDDLENI